MGGFFQKHWALMLLGALSMVLLALLFEISWPQTYVQVVTVPSGALLTDDGGYSWTSPARIPVPEEGIHLTASSPGWIPLDTLILPVQTGSVITLGLGYRFDVILESDPPGAVLTLDGSHAGLTPTTVELDTPGAHEVTLTLTGGATLTDSFNVLSNTPRTLRWVLPEVAGNGMLLVRSGCTGTVSPGPSGPDTLPSFLISLREVTAGELLPWLQYLEPEPDGESAYRWGRTATIESIFPGDYPIPFRIGGGGAWEVTDGMEDLPVAGISFGAALDFCGWLTVSRADGCLYRLPTEAEWAVAAAGGGSGPWPWGTRSPDGTLLNLSDVNEVLLQRHPYLDDGYEQSAPVGSYPPNGWGIYDMAGNVWEWCLPVFPDTVPLTRGGSWISSMDDCRCHSRMLPDTSLGYPFTGFRVAATPSS
jgi:formylglycine-generating enzyme required for sulfatase activity